VNQKPPLSYLLAFAWTVGAAMCLLWLVHLGVALRPASSTDVVQLGGIEALVFVLGVFGVLGLHGVDAPLGRSLGLRPTHPALTLLGLTLGFVAHFPAESVDAFVDRYFPESAADLAAEATLLTASSPARLVMVLLVVACVGPLVEELFFRGALFGTLRKNHRLFGTAFVTAVCFVVGHLDYRKWPALAVVAIVLGQLRAVSGSLLPSLAMHVAFNAVTVLAFFTGEVSSAPAPRIEAIPVVAGWITTSALMLAVQYFGSRAPQARRGRAEDAE
jgi:uncharacterized protein